MNFSDRWRHRFVWLNLPASLLIALLQRMPALPLVGGADDLLAGVPRGLMWRSAVAGVAAMGALHSMAGATQTTQFSAPKIALQPVSQTVNAGSTLTVYVIATGNPAPTYQWRKNGVFLAGANLYYLTLTNVQSGDAAMYTVLVNNALGGVISNGAIVTVITPAVAPLLVAQPASQTALVGASVSFSATATGVPAPTYQWLKDGLVIPGATTSTLNLGNVQLADAGSYSLVSTNSAGTATSNGAVLTVDAAPAITMQPASQTVIEGATVTLAGAASGTPTPACQWQKDGTNLVGETSATLTLSNVALGAAGTYSMVATNPVGSAASNGAALTVTAATSAPVITAQPVSQTVIQGGSVTFTASAGGKPTPTYQWQKGGVNVSGATNSSLTLSSVQPSDSDAYTVVAINSVGSATSDGAVLTVDTAPVITTQPVSQTVTAGANVTLTGGASGNPAPGYQWQKDGANIAGATSASLNLSSVQPGAAGAYTLVATNLVSAATSTGAVLTINFAPAITIQPLSQAVTAGGSVTLASEASGNPAPTYQWQKDGSDLAGATNSSLTLANVQSGGAGTYTAVATNSVSSVTSTGAVLTVNTPPAITTQPAGQTVTAGGNVTFTSGASGNPAPDYQWQKDGTDLPGATNSSLTLVAVPPGAAGTYRVVATNSVSSATSTGAVLTVNYAPAITTPPASQAVTVGTGVTFTAAANGNPAPTYQWKKGGVDIVGATHASYTIAATIVGDAATYTVVATNLVSSATSPGAVLTINVPPAITLQPAGQTVTAGNPVTFTATASGSPAPTYQWSFNGSEVAGATGGSYTIASTTGSNTGSYTVVATNVAGSAASNTVALVVNVPPAITTQPIGNFVTVGANVTLVVAAGGYPAPTFQWQRNGADISGATGATLTLTNVQLSDGAVYTASATNLVGAATSNATTLTVTTAPASPVLCDFNNDGQPDLLWRNLDTGAVAVWFMSGTAVQSALIIGYVPTDWQIAGTGDFNGDGQTDILWRKASTGAVAFWFMNGTAIQSTLIIANVSADWEIAGTGDFNADGQVDILWRKPSTGEIAFWLMNGTNILSAPIIANVSTDWQIAGTGDFNGDGRMDILWRKPATGEVAVWGMNGTAVSTAAIIATVPTDWQITATGDFSGDGQVDIVWRKTSTGALAFWIMNGTAISSTQSIATISADWVVSN